MAAPHGDPIALTNRKTARHMVGAERFENCSGWNSTILPPGED